MFFVLFVDKVQEELDQVVENRQVRVGDRKSLPFTDAVIHEIQRVINTTPFIVRCVSQDVTFQSYLIKKVKQKSNSPSSEPISDTVHVYIFIFKK